MSGLSLSVVVPVKDGAAVLDRCLSALARSDLPRERWELVVVDDGSEDGSFELASRWADRTLRVADGPRGPAHARNLGSETASGDVLVFVDADVVVHEDTLRRVAEAFEKGPDLGAAFGAYDDQPAHDGFISQYRNLLHRYVHLQGAGEAHTFWAGCGAVRADAFAEVGGFDAPAFPRPQIEDIELGYRLCRAGHRIEIRPEIQAKHLKRWSFSGMVRTDLLDRGIPWMRLLLERGAPEGGRKTLNVKTVEKVKTGLLGLAVALSAASLVLRDLRPALVAVVLLAVLVAMNMPVYRWFAARRGFGFALRVVPLHLLYYFLSGLAVVGALIPHLGRRGARATAAKDSRLAPVEGDGR